MKRLNFVFLALFIFCATNDYAQQRGGVEITQKKYTPPAPTPSQSETKVDVSNYCNVCGVAACQLVAIDCGATFDNPYVIPKKNLNTFINKLSDFCSKRNQQTNTTGKTNYTIVNPSGSKSSGNFWRDLGRDAGANLANGVFNLAMSWLFSPGKNVSQEPKHIYEFNGKYYKSEAEFNAAIKEYNRFNDDKKDLLANLQGMTPKNSQTLELIGGNQESNNSLKLIGPGQTSAANDLEIIGMNTNQKSIRGVVIDNTNGMPSVRPDKETEKLWESDRRDQEVEDWMAQRSSEQRRREDRERYERDMPLYDRTIKSFNENPINTKAVDIGIAAGMTPLGYAPPPGETVSNAYLVKGTVILMDKTVNFVKDDIPKLVAGQAITELKAVASDILSRGFEFITDGRWGKPEVEAGKGFVDTGTNFIRLFQKDEAGEIKVVNMYKNDQVINEVNQTVYGTLQSYSDVDNTYNEEKFGGGGIPSHKMFAPSTIVRQAKSDATNVATNALISKLQDGPVKDGATYLSRNRRNSTAYGFYEYKIESAIKIR